jgi:carbonic anhydrase
MAIRFSLVPVLALFPVLSIFQMAFANDEHASNAAHAEKPAAPTAHGKTAPAVVAPAGTSASSAPAPEAPEPNDVLKRLVAGNRRFMNATMAHPNQTVERRTDLATSQSPFAIIVSCSDSRVSPELIFDQGIGDLFVIRSAGEVVSEIGIGSIEYAVEHLSVPVIMVLGHERCGAVKATVAGGEAPGSIGSIVELIKPAVAKARGQTGDVLDNAIKNNVNLVAEKIAISPIIHEALLRGKLKIVRGVYDLDDGQVKAIP